MLKHLLPTLFLSVPLAVSAVAAEEENSVIASINGHPVILSEVLEMTAEQERLIQPLYQGAERYERVLKLRREALDRLIDRKLLAAAYQQADFRLPPQELERSLDELSAGAGVRTRREFAAKLQAEGMSFEAFREKVHEQLMAQVMLFRQYKIRVYVSPRDVRDYYNAHPEEFGEPERWQLTMLDLPEDAATRQSILTELQKNPAAFATFAKTAAPRTVRKSGLRPEWIAAAGDAPAPGRICGPLEIGGRYCCFRLEKILPAETTPFAEVEPAIREKLEMESRRAAAGEYLQELRDNAIIRLMM
ncbi:MAG: peptidyl-prolyl cis-trans isomerase [Lentisphaeria bacterium]|nr:peptidyl-prolyl cis-trans isomerase [Lentisphaeria bacterium]